MIMQVLDLDDAMTACDGDLFDIGMELVSEIDAASDGEQTPCNQTLAPAKVQVTINFLRSQPPFTAL